MYEHAFHTSCRDGITGRPGFQFNAASTGLSEIQLHGLAAAHAGYQAPRDLPAQPDREQLALFPIALKYALAESVGPSLSRTVYVGREFRGRDGAPDSGRFGNYFSHILAGQAGDSPFGELLPIELWEADHWQDAESPARTLAPIADLSPGALTVERTLAVLGPARAAWIPRFVDVTCAALCGGPRVVLIDQPGEVAAAWMALACFALPRALALDLTFSTFEGSPRTANVRLCATTSSCDVGFEAHELGRMVELLDLTTEPPPASQATLLGRIVGALAAEGGEALCTAARTAFPRPATERRYDEESQAEPGRDALALGPQLSLAAARADLARGDEERAAVLRSALAQLSSPYHRPGLGARLLGLQPTPSPGGEEIAAWLRLHAAARLAGRESDADLVDVCLKALIPVAERVGGPEGEPIAPVSATSPTQAPVARLAMWMDSLAAQRPDSLAACALGGWRLGLVGANSELDRDLAEALAAEVARPDVGEVIELWSADPHARDLMGHLAVCLARRCVEQPQAMQALDALARRRPEIRAHVEEHADSTPAFAVRLACVRLCLHDRPGRRAALVAELAPLALTDGQQAAVRGLYEELERPEQIAELIGCYLDGAGQVPAVEIATGLSALRTLSLDGSREQSVAAATLARLLSRTGPEIPNRGEYAAWYLASHPPGGGRRSTAEWVRWLCFAVRRPVEELPDERLAELLQMAARVVFDARSAEEHIQAFDAIAHAVDAECWAQTCQLELARRLERHRDPARCVADLFVTWKADPAPSSLDLMSSSVFGAALERWPARRREQVGDALPPDRREEWALWCNEHPPASMLGRTFGRRTPRRERT
jgi:GTPase-associated protein 1, N-terminal domain type 2/GTPase-associated protein 1, middle domain